MNEIQTTDDSTSGALILNSDAMRDVMAFASMMAGGRATVPTHLQGNPSDCAAVVMQAMRWRMDPFVVAQKTHVVSGHLGYEAQLVNAVVCGSGAIIGRPSYEYFGKWDGVNGKTSNDFSVGVTISAQIKGESEPRTLQVSMGTVGKVRNSPLWEADPRQQIAYLAVKRWSRMHTPDVLLGVYTPDEFEQSVSNAKQSKNMGRADVVTQECPPEILELAAKAAIKGAESYRDFFTKLSREDRKLLMPHHEEFKASSMQSDSSRTIEQDPEPESKSGQEQSTDDFINALGDE